MKKWFTALTIAVFIIGMLFGGLLRWVGERNENEYAINAPIYIESHKSITFTREDCRVAAMDAVETKVRHLQNQVDILYVHLNFSIDKIRRKVPGLRLQGECINRREFVITDNWGL